MSDENFSLRERTFPVSERATSHVICGLTESGEGGRKSKQRRSEMLCRLTHAKWRSLNKALLAKEEERDHVMLLHVLLEALLLSHDAALMIHPSLFLKNSLKSQTKHEIFHNPKNAVVRKLSKEKKKIFFHEFNLKSFCLTHLTAMLEERVCF